MREAEGLKPDDAIGKREKKRKIILQGWASKRVVAVNEKAGDPGSAQPARLLVSSREI